MLPTKFVLSLVCSQQEVEREQGEGGKVVMFQEEGARLVAPVRSYHLMEVEVDYMQQRW